jgi:mannose-6-phosphate isomerase-like protein (cupin superfamily)
VSGGPTILLVDSGLLTVELGRTSADSARVIRATEPSGQLLPGGAVTLGAGDALLLTAGGTYRVRSEGSTPAGALTVWAANQTVVSGLSPADHRAAIPSGQGQSTGTPASAATPAPAAGDVSIVLPDGAAIVTIGRVALAPGASLARHRVANAELALVDAGRLDLTIEDGTASVRAAPVGEMTVEGSIMLAAGDRVLVDGGTTVAYRNEGSETLVLVLITIGPAPDGGETAPAGG